MHVIDPAQSHLLIVDLQQRLLPAIDGSEAITDNALRLLQSANLLDTPVSITEQLPARLGSSLEKIQALYQHDVFEKSSFDACTDPALLACLKDKRDIIILGAETHVCVLQTALGLLRNNYRVFVVQDACGSRTPANKRAGLDRMAAAGAILVSTEMVVFEWLQNADHPHFREILKLIK